MSKIDSEVFRFEDLPGEHGLFDFLGCLNNGVYYETPMSWFDVVKLLDQGGASCIGHSGQNQYP